MSLSQALNQFAQNLGRYPGGIRMILGQYQTGAGRAGHAAKAVSQIKNVVLGPGQGVVDILTGA